MYINIDWLYDLQNDRLIVTLNTLIKACLYFCICGSTSLCVIWLLWQDLDWYQSYVWSTQKLSSRNQDELLSPVLVLCRERIVEYLWFHTSLFFSTSYGSPVGPSLCCLWKRITECIVTLNHYFNSWMPLKYRHIAT